MLASSLGCCRGQTCPGLKPQRCSPGPKGLDQPMSCVPVRALKAGVSSKTQPWQLRSRCFSTWGLAECEMGSAQSSCIGKYCLGSVRWALCGGKRGGNATEQQVRVEKVCSMHGGCAALPVLLTGGAGKEQSFPTPAPWRAGGLTAGFGAPLKQRGTRPRARLAAVSVGWGRWVSAAPLRVAGRPSVGPFRINAVPHSCLVQEKRFCWIQL